MTGRPVFSTGHEPSASEFVAAFPLYGMNTTGDQAVPNSTTLVDATGLSIPLITGNWYDITGTLWVDSATANDTKIAIAGTATIGYIIWTLQSVPGGGTNGQWYSAGSTNAANAWTAEGLGAGQSSCTILRATVQCTGSGTFKVQFAEATAGAGTQAKMLKGSFIKGVVASP